MPSARQLFCEIAEGVHVAEPLAAVVERYLRGIERDCAASVQGDGLDVKTLEVVQPELRIVVAWIVLGKADLGPPHRFVVPAGLRRVHGGLRPCTDTGPEKCCGRGGAVYPKNIRRLLAILLFLNFLAIVTTALSSHNAYLRAITAASLAGTLTVDLLS